MAAITVLSSSELREASPTPGMLRRDGLVAEHVRGLHVTTAPGSISGWHHHGDHETVGYVIGGGLRLEWGPGGAESVEAGPDDFFLVPPNTIHRESNPTKDDQVVVGFRIGTGPDVVNVDGPAER